MGRFLARDNAGSGSVGASTSSSWETPSSSIIASYSASCKKWVISSKTWLALTRKKRARTHLFEKILVEFIGDADGGEDGDDEEGQGEEED